MATHIAIEGQVPRPVNDIKTLLPAVSFPYDEITSTSGLESIIALAGYEPCTVGSLPELAWNQTAVLGASTRSGGVLSASYTATNLSENDAAALLAAYKQVALAAVDTVDNEVINSIASYANANNTKSLSLRLDIETSLNLTRLMVVAQNAETGVTIVDANGTSVELTLSQLLEIGAAHTEAAKTIADQRAYTRSVITNASTPSAAETAAQNYADQYGP